MATIPSDSQIVFIAPDVNMTERKSAITNAQTEVFTMQDITDTASAGGGGAGVFEEGSGTDSIQDSFGGASATGDSSFAFGNGTLAEGLETFAFTGGQAQGGRSVAGIQGSAIGNSSIALGYASQAGYTDNGSPYSDSQVAIGTSSFAKGQFSTAIGSNAFDFAYASGYSSMALGGGAKASGDDSFAASGGTASGPNSFAASGATATGQHSFAFGQGTIAAGTHSHARGNSAWASQMYSSAWGLGAYAFGPYSFAFGINATTSGGYAFALGNQVNASGFGSSASGEFVTASGNNSFAHGMFTTASGSNSFAIGNSCSATGNGSGVLGTGAASHTGALALNCTSNRSSAVHVNELSIMSIPTSAAGLPSGAVWRNGTVLNIVA